VLDASVTLSDGRLLAYTDLGAPGGPVVMYRHGAPTSRLDLSGFEHAFAERGVRVVSADRPGYGGSSPQPGRRLEDWPSDVAALADHLGVERFAVMAWSSGGPYAVACAALLPGRVASAGVVAGVTDFGWPGAWNDYVEDEVTLMQIGDEAGAATWCEDRYGADGSGLIEAGLGKLAPADQAALQDRARATALMTTVGEALRQGVGGYAQDITLQGRAWSFGLRSSTHRRWSECSFEAVRAATAVLVEKQTSQPTPSRLSPRTTSTSADRSRADASFALAKRASEQAFAGR
jgi:pimeloyl-ACP methyl ester carboxylesterase